ncbi:MAG: hypothetical protein QF903_05225 [Planctomycetota bacterium]|jgi:hypothetical protein|nr:hypothetical protein [Planctomycetota bacterium]MDP6761814.1 hypothetical protein [Planctomycetota bacterium]MDP6988860.1 hypothetical protein [Planctomycetota bacterium]
MVAPVPRETVSGVLGIGLALAAIAGAFVVLVGMGERSEDPAALLAKDFDVGELPFGLALLEARALPTGEQVVVLGVPGEGASPPDSIAEDSAPAPFERAFLVRHPEDAIEAVLERQFRRLSYEPPREGPDKRVDLPLAGGRLRWGELAPSFVRVRRKLADGYRESVRANLYRPGRPWIAYAVWPAGEPASEESLQALLTALPPLGGAP